MLNVFIQGHLFMKRIVCYCNFSLYSWITSCLFLFFLFFNVYNRGIDKEKRYVIVGSNRMKRIDKINYYLDLAETVLERSTCMRSKYGAVIVKNDEIIATGYNGAPRGRKNCCEMGRCIREELKIPRGERYELCRSVHAEQNAIISAERTKMIDSTLYLVGRKSETKFYVEKPNPCSLCKRMIINAGIKDIYIRDSKEDYRHIDVSKYIENDESLEGVLGY